MTDSEPKPAEQSPVGEPAESAEVPAPAAPQPPEAATPPEAVTPAPEAPEATPPADQPTPPPVSDEPTTEPAADPAPDAAEPEPQEAEGPPPAREGVFLGTGRRKSSVARVRMSAGDGQFIVNERPVDVYFTEPQDRVDVQAPLDTTGVRKQWNVRVLVHGGGHTGQAGAIRLGLARALAKAHDQFEPALRDAGYLTRDARRVERKKYGQRKARRRFQFSKR